MISDAHRIKVWSEEQWDLCTIIKGLQQSMISISFFGIICDNLLHPTIGCKHKRSKSRVFSTNTLLCMSSSLASLRVCNISDDQDSCVSLKRSKPLHLYSLTRSPESSCANVKSRFGLSIGWLLRLCRSCSRYWAPYQHRFLSNILAYLFFFCDANIMCSSYMFSIPNWVLCNFCD